MAENNVNIPPTNHVKVLGGQGWIGLVDRLGTETSIVNAARVSFGKIRTEMDDRDAALVRYLIKNHHTSPLEHVVFTFLVHCPLFIRAHGATMKFRAATRMSISNSTRRRNCASRRRAIVRRLVLRSIWIRRPARR